MNASSDFRNVQTPVRDQGSRGACVGFAVAAAHEWMRPGTIRSVEDVLWAAHQIGGDPNIEGTRVQFALQGLQQHRHADEVAWPFGSPPFPAQRPESAKDALYQADITTWRALTSVDVNTVADEVARGSAVVLTLAVVLGAWPSSGVIDAPPGRKTPGAHAVLALGTSTQRAETRALIKNSWGSGWGVDGYGFVSSRYMENYALAGHVMEPVA